MKPMNSFFVNPKMRCKGFTLVELLLVMAIIGILSGLALVVVNEAQYDAQAYFDSFSHLNVGSDSETKSRNST